MGGHRTAVRVLIADDHDLFAQSVEAFLSMEERIDIVGRAANGAEAARLATETQPDVVLMDISMPVMDGFEAAKAILEVAPDARVLFLTGSNAPADVAEARAAGGIGYVTKEKIASELVDAILAAAPASG
jgi:DNA-binding NarL/FixJ family response regulator